MTPIRKPLVLAMLAVGLIGSEGLPEARSTVFVPELALLDGALCAEKTALPMRPMLVAGATRPAQRRASKHAGSQRGIGTCIGRERAHFSLVILLIRAATRSTNPSMLSAGPRSLLPEN